MKTKKCVNPGLDQAGNTPSPNPGDSADCCSSESEQLFRALVENSPDYIARYNQNFRRIYTNGANELPRLKHRGIEKVGRFRRNRRLDTDGSESRPYLERQFRKPSKNQSRPKED